MGGEQSFEEVKYKEVFIRITPLHETDPSEFWERINYLTDIIIGIIELAYGSGSISDLKDKLNFCDEQKKELSNIQSKLFDIETKIDLSMYSTCKGKIATALTFLVDYLDSGDYSTYQRFHDKANTALETMKSYVNGASGDCCLLNYFTVLTSTVHAGFSQVDQTDDNEILYNELKNTIEECKIVLKDEYYKIISTSNESWSWAHDASVPRTPETMVTQWDYSLKSDFNKTIITVIYDVLEIDHEKAKEILNNYIKEEFNPKYIEKTLKPVKAFLDM
jgi:hypothetical protein